MRDEKLWNRNHTSFAASLAFFVCIKTRKKKNKAQNDLPRISRSLQDARIERNETKKMKQNLIDNLTIT